MRISTFLQDLFRELPQVRRSVIPQNLVLIKCNVDCFYPPGCATPGLDTHLSRFLELNHTNHSNVYFQNIQPL